MFFAAPTTRGDNGSSLNTLENFLGCNQVSGKGMVEIMKCFQLGQSKQVIGEISSSPSSCRATIEVQD